MPTNVHSQFVAWFRSAAPYFNAFRGKTFVIAFGGEVVADGKFGVLTQDINLLRSTGIRLVLVHGSRPQIEAQLKLRRARSRYHAGVRITLSLIHISEPTRQAEISYAVFCLKK